MSSKFFTFFTAILICLVLSGYGKNNSVKNSTRQDYINRYSKLAIKEMNEYAIPASIILAQACLESGDGNSLLSRTSNNHFGIKCKSTWTGERVYHDDDEKGECFRKYSSPVESFRGHSKFLNESDRYKFLFSYDIRDYRQWAYGLKKAGYATNPQYPQMLIKIIEDYNLNELDKYYKEGTTRHGWNLFAGLKHTTIIETDRTVEKRNGRNALLSRKGDTFEGIASEFQLSEEEIFKYNDCSKGNEPETNSVIFLQAKKRRAPKGNDYHVAKENESLWSIAQWYGVRMKSLYRFNNMKPGQEPHPGQVIALRKKLRGAE